MNEHLVMKGRGVSPGRAEGTALVSRQRIGFNYGVDPHTGIIVEKNHELEGKSVRDTILVFPGGKGSTGGSFLMYRLSHLGTGPKAIVNIETETIVAVGAIISKIPLVDKLDHNPVETVLNGDYVKVDGNNGIIEIWRRHT